LGAPRRDLHHYSRTDKLGVKTMDACDRFLAWARDHEGEMTVPLIRETWGVSRATAYRRIAGVRSILEAS